MSNVPSTRAIGATLNSRRLTQTDVSALLPSVESGLKRVTEHQRHEVIRPFKAEYERLDAIRAENWRAGYREETPEIQRRTAHIAGPPIAFASAKPGLMTF